MKLLPSNLALKKFAIFIFWLLGINAFTAMGAANAQSVVTDGAVVAVNQPWLIEPLALTRPISTETLGRLYSEADSFYQSKRYPQAQEAFRQLLELDHQLAAAWFRMGNTWQQMGQMGWATHAYLLAAREGGTQLRNQPEQIAQKALANIVNHHIQVARQAIEKMEALGIVSGNQLNEHHSALAGLVDAGKGLKATNVVNRYTQKPTPRVNNLRAIKTKQAPQASPPRSRT